MIDRTRHVRRRNGTGHRLGITSRMAGVICVETLTTLARSPANGAPFRKRLREGHNGRISSRWRISFQATRATLFAIATAANFGGLQLRRGTIDAVGGRPHQHLAIGSGWTANRYNG
jgi:hypothetical protein